MTEKSDSPSAKAAGLTRRGFINGIIGIPTLAAVGAPLAWADSAFTGACISTADAGPPLPEEIIKNGKKLSTLEQLMQHPTSRSAMMLLSLLTYSRGDADKKTLEESKIPIFQSYERDDNAKDTYRAAVGKYSNRSPLYTVTLADPETHSTMRSTTQGASSKSNPLKFRMIAHHSDPNPKNDFEAAAYVTDNGSLLVVLSGINPSKLSPLVETMKGNLNPQLKDVDAFMQDVQHQIEAQKLQIKDSVIFGHSIGADSAVKALAYCMEHKEMQKLIGRKIPQAVLLEDWMGMQTAEACARDSKGTVTVQDLAKHSISIRHWPASFTGEKENPPLGAKVAIMPKHPERVDMSLSAIASRQMEHRILPTVARLFSGEENIHEQFKGDFVATHFFSDIADPVFRAGASHPVATGTALATGAITAPIATGALVRAGARAVGNYAHTVIEGRHAKAASISDPNEPTSSSPER